MSAVSRKLMPASRAASTTATVWSESSRQPKLLQPRPTMETFSEPILRVSMVLPPLLEASGCTPPARRARQSQVDLTLYCAQEELHADRHLPRRRRTGDRRLLLRAGDAQEPLGARRSLRRAAGRRRARLRARDSLWLRLGPPGLHPLDRLRGGSRRIDRAPRVPARDDRAAAGPAVALPVPRHGLSRPPGHADRRRSRDRPPRAVRQPPVLLPVPADRGGLVRGELAAHAPGSGRAGERAAVGVGALGGAGCGSGAGTT